MFDTCCKVGGEGKPADLVAHDAWFDAALGKAGHGAYKVVTIAYYPAVASNVMTWC